MTVLNEAPYVIDDRQLIVDTPDVRVQILTLGNGQEIPWHLHTSVTDTIACLDGPMVVKIRDVAKEKELQVGETFTVPLKTPHQVAGKDGGPCRFMVVQGVGKYDFIPLKRGPDG
jgi:quercetin dioxygenase-like cupin family protein